ncbi:MAG: hypothetical protein IT458_12465 [Planctomycetes bacterium]|nr:hypothetical protein [Planctomycetota bacterium]
MASDRAAPADLRRPALALGALGLGIVAAFAYQRSASVFLAVERDAAVYRTVAAEAPLPLAEILAMAELRGGVASKGELLELARRYLEWLRIVRSPQLAFAAAEGHERLALELRDRTPHDLAAAERELRRRPEGRNPARFTEMTRRYQTRL